MNEAVQQGIALPPVAPRTTVQQQLNTYKLLNRPAT